MPLTVQDLELRLGGATILDGLTLNLGPTGCTMVMGPNGAGKSLLLKLLHGLMQPTAGRIDEGALDGIDAVVHLAGAGIGDKRWSDSYKRELLESRTTGTTVISASGSAATP